MRVMGWELWWVICRIAGLGSRWWATRGCRLGHPATQERSLVGVCIGGSGKTREWPCWFFYLKFFHCVWQNLIKFIEDEKRKSCGAGFVVLENHKGVWQKLLHMNLKDPYTVVLDPQQHLPKSSERQGLFIMHPSCTFFLLQILIF